MTKARLVHCASVGDAEFRCDEMPVGVDGFDG